MTVGGNRQIRGIGDATTGCHSAARAVAGCRDDGVFDDDLGTIALTTVVTSVATVAEDAVGTLCI